MFVYMAILIIEDEKKLVDILKRALRTEHYATDVSYNGQGDIIIKLDGQRVTSDTQLSAMISKKKVGDVITITIYRDGKMMDVNATLTSATEQ